MTKTGAAAWRVDTLDPLGGLAFVSYRISELEAAFLDAGIPAIFVGAPTFEPVNLTSRSAGLAASRRSFQTGLFIKDDEVGFPELEDAIEFVRRCYVRGGGGAGSAPGGGPLPLPEGGPVLPSGPLLEEIGRREAFGAKVIRLTDILGTDLMEYSNHSSYLGSRPPGQSFEMTWHQPPGPPPSSAFPRAARPPSEDGADVLIRGAVHLIDEMIRRVPVLSTDPDELMNWLVAYERLAVAIDKMGIWPLVWQPPHQRHLADMFLALRRFAMNRRSGLIFQWLDGLGESAELLFNWDWDIPWRANQREWTDAIDDLHQWPVPPRLAQALSVTGNNGNPTLLNFLAAFLANPPAVNASPLIVPEIDLALFAAARVVASCSRNWADHAGDTFYLLGSRAPESVHRRMLVRLAESAWAWLVGQLPRRGFGPMLEQAIEKTSSLVAA